ncbi:MAG: DUF4159 domain-containing protein [Aestuariivirga sp.]|nr:DUF4159 domain-containing protein [Aestuariivirga sp.]
MMAFLQALTFTTPVALAGLLLLPVIWWLLRFTPPKPQTVKFPPLRLLLELVSKHEQPDKTPWWLMLLRLAIAALVILGVSHPFYAPGQTAAGTSAPLLIIVDDTWAAAKDWSLRRTMLNEIVGEARENNVTLTLATSAPSAREADIVARDADATLKHIAALEPKALGPDRAKLLVRLRTSFSAATSLHVVWLSDGLDQASATAFAEGLTSLASGNAQVDAIMPDATALPMAFATPTTEGGQFKAHLLRPSSSTASRETNIRAVAANGRSLAEVKVAFVANATQAEATLDLPIELRNEVQRLEILGERNAAATFLFDDRWRRKTIALQSGSSLEDAQPLLSPLYYVSRALEPYAQITEPEDAAQLKEQLEAGLSMLVLADIGVIPAETADAINPWLERGGVLLRFAGPRMAGAQDELVPVTLRSGGRALGSALSWEEPQNLQAFPDNGPFAGLPLDQSVTVSRQVLAEPDMDLPDKVWASLADGTPLVTAKRQGKGLIVLFHVTANADWSNLPLSGLFVEMLRRINDLAPGAGGGASAGASSSDDRATAFIPRLALSAAGELIEPLPDSKPISPADIEKAKPTPETPAGLYNRASAERAINLLPDTHAMMAITALPNDVTFRSFAMAPRQPLAPLLFTLAFLLFLGDTLAALFLGGGWHRLRGMTAALLILLVMPNDHAMAQQADEYAQRATQETRLAYVRTGDDAVDNTSEQGLKGLGLILTDRTSVTPGSPIGVSIENDEIVFFPLVYWPVLDGAAVPTPATLAKMDAYMKNGGTIFFDLRDDALGLESLSGAATGATDALRRILAKLDIPPLEPVPENHVLTKAFYLLRDFPGRYARGQLWVERSDTSSTNNVDGVSSIIIGSNDYAAAWALDDNSNPLYAVIPGNDRQREMAFRTGINVVMYALTGNYKADQVHIPALLERLGQ